MLNIGKTEFLPKTLYDAHNFGFQRLIGIYLLAPFYCLPKWEQHSPKPPSPIFQIRPFYTNDIREIVTGNPNPITELIIEKSLWIYILSLFFKERFGNRYHQHPYAFFYL